MMESLDLLPGHKHGLRLAAPVLAAAGACGYGTDARTIACSGLGAIVTRTLTRRPRRPAPLPRFVETPAGLVHRLHVGNAGLSAVVRRANWAASPIPIIVSVAGTPEDCAHMAGRLDETPGVAGVELSLWTLEPDEAEAVVYAVRVTTSLPVLAKLSSAEPDLVSLARVCEQAGVDVLVVGGPWPASPPIDGVEWEDGWLSGPALLPLVLPRIRQVAGIVTVPVVGCGGVHAPADVQAYLRAGAQAVQVGSALLVDPTLADHLLAQVPVTCEVTGTALP